MIAISYKELKIPRISSTLILRRNRRGLNGTSTTSESNRQTHPEPRLVPLVFQSTNTPNKDRCVDDVKANEEIVTSSLQQLYPESATRNITNMISIDHLNEVSLGVYRYEISSYPIEKSKKTLVTNDLIIHACNTLTGSGANDITHFLTSIHHNNIGRRKREGKEDLSICRGHILT